MKSIKLTDNNFDAEVIKSDIPVLIDFYADWCGPCKMLSPIIERIAEDTSDIKVGKINIDEELGLAKKFGVMSIPTIIVIKNGVITNKAVGYQSKDKILALLK